jgi:hypothetical protein
MWFNPEIYSPSPPEKFHLYFKEIIYMTSYNCNINITVFPLSALSI